MIRRRAGQLIWIKLFYDKEPDFALQNNDLGQVKKRRLVLQLVGVRARLLRKVV